MLSVETQNSTYEIDSLNKRIRRLNGSEPPTRWEGPDMVWKEYFRLSKISGCYLIEWDDEDHSTFTSRVVTEKKVALQ